MEPTTTIAQARAVCSIPSAPPEDSGSRASPREGAAGSFTGRNKGEDPY